MGNCIVYELYIKKVALKNSGMNKLLHKITEQIPMEGILDNPLHYESSLYFEHDHFKTL